jgi:hypothetical protein
MTGSFTSRERIDTPLGVPPKRLLMGAHIGVVASGKFMSQRQPSRLTIPRKAASHSRCRFSFLSGLAWSLSVSLCIGDGALAYLRRSESGNVYLTRFVALQYITRDLPTAAKIYLLFIGWRAYYYERGWFTIAAISRSFAAASHCGQSRINPTFAKTKADCPPMMREGRLGACLNKN